MVKTNWAAQGFSEGFRAINRGCRGRGIRRNSFQITRILRRCQMVKRVKPEQKIKRRKVTFSFESPNTAGAIPNLDEP
jgi:hypothetical protein